MGRFKYFFKLLLFAAVAVLLVVTTLPVSKVSAAGLTDEPVPVDSQNGYPRLERVFRRLQRQVERQGRALVQGDHLVERAQTLIDKAKEKGLDASKVQVALDELVAVVPAVKDAHVESVSIVEEHAGFDQDGKVTNPDHARQTVETLRKALGVAREKADGKGRDLLRAIRNFLKENRDSLNSEKTAES